MQDVKLRTAAERRQNRRPLSTGEADALDTAPVQRVSTGDSAIVAIAQRLAADSRDFIHFRCRLLERELRAEQSRMSQAARASTRALTGTALLALGGLFLLLAAAQGLASLAGLSEGVSLAIVGAAALLGGLAARKLRRVEAVVVARPRALEEAMEHVPVRALAGQT